MSKVLIVEDEKLLSDVYNMVLSMNGFETVVAVNGIEALRIIPDFSPDIVLLDLLMPQMDGITFLKSFKPKCHHEVKIIVYSNLFDSRKEAEIRKLGAIDIVLKSSVTPEGLVELIQSHLVSGTVYN